MTIGTRLTTILMLAVGLAWCCAFNIPLREYLNVFFWLPFAKRPADFERANVQRVDAPFAGMSAAQGARPIDELRKAYQQLATPQGEFDVEPYRKAVLKAREDASITRREREEVDLIGAKIDMRAGASPESFDGARTKFEHFIRTAQTPEFISEARGWLARVYLLQGNQTAAGKIYLDELNRDGSNLSRETILNSLRLTYGNDGGEIVDHLDEYFDTPEHAVFAIQMITNPRSDEQAPFSGRGLADRIRAAVDGHPQLLRSETGANALALLLMRAELRSGDPQDTVRIAQRIPASAAVRDEPDFNWMLAGADYLSHHYSAAEAPLLKLRNSARATDDQREAALYALCAVYRKTRNVRRQFEFALAIFNGSQSKYVDASRVEDLSIYWAFGGWDLNMLLEAEAPLNVLQSFAQANPKTENIDRVRYAIAVRLARENRYEESAHVYDSVNASRRAVIMRQLAKLYARAEQRPSAKYELAEFIAAHPTGIYFNDHLWDHFQRYALNGDREQRFTSGERQAQAALERKLRDDQEEYWRAYLVLRDVINDTANAPLARKATLLAIHCLEQIQIDRFGRKADIRNIERDLVNRLRIRSARPPQVQ